MFDPTQRPNPTQTLSMCAYEMTRVWLNWRSH